MSNPTILFYTPAQVYFNGVSGGAVATSIPWVNNFQDRPQGASVVVLNTQLGIDAPGLYAHMVDALNGGKTWKLLMTLAQLTAALATASTFSVIINANATVTYAAPNVVYANGQVVSNGATTASTTVGYVVTTPPTISGGAFTFATLPSAVTVGAGSRAYITDANSTTFLAAAAGGGANKVPVFSDGAIWKIG